MHFITRRAGYPRPILAWVLALGSLVLLSGCGGGGGINGTSTTSEGFRIVPAGGSVVPLTDSSNHALVTIATSPDAVSSGIQVSATSIAASQTIPTFLGNAPAGTSTVAVGAYQITFNPDSPSLSSTAAPAVLTLAYTPAAALPANSTLSIYRYDGTKWTVLPFTTTTAATPTAPATIAGTLETVSADSAGNVTLTPYLKSGTYAVFATAPPTAPAL